MSQLNFTGGLSTPTWGDPGLWYAAVARAAGRMLLSTLTVTDVTASVEFGFDVNTAGALGGSVLRFTGDTLKVYPSGVAGPTVFVPADATAYQLAVVLRTAGSYYFIKGGAFTYWTLLWHGVTDSNATLYPAISNYDAALTADNVRVPTRLWLPTNLAYDTFTRANGALGNSETVGPDAQAVTARAWTGATWTVVTNAAVNTPVAGAEALTNGNFAAWTGDDPDSWTLNAVETGAIYVTEAAGKARLVSDGTSFGIRQAAGLTAGTWYLQTLTISDVTAGGITTNEYGIVNIALYDTTGSKLKTWRATSTADFSIQRSGATDVTFDDVSVKPLTLAELFASVAPATASVLADVNITRTAGTQSGLVTNLDSATVPANFILTYLDGSGSIKVDKCVAGTYTNLATTAFTYSAGATLRVITYLSGADLKVRVYYNGSLVGSELTVSDAGIVGNTLAGLFSTSNLNSFDNFVLMPRGNGDEYAALDAM